MRLNMPQRLEHVMRSGTERLIRMALGLSHPSTETNRIARQRSFQDSGRVVWPQMCPRGQILRKGVPPEARGHGPPFGVEWKSLIECRLMLWREGCCLTPRVQAG